jgi:hypothetical protein
MGSLSLIPFALCIAILFAPRAEGSIFLITNPQDTTSVASLRGAIIRANQIGGNNTIILEALHKNAQHQSVFPLTLSGADEDAAQTGDLDVKQGSLTIMGLDSEVIIDATDLGDRVFQVFPKAHLTLSHLIIRGGTAPGNGRSPFANGEAGGAIYNAGILHLEHCIITNNASGGGGDPGISTIGSLPGQGGNGGSGAGICNAGQLQINFSSVYSNYAGSGGGNGGTGGSGAGIFNVGRLSVNTSTISDNVCGNGGSGYDGSNSKGFAGSGSVGGAGGSGGGIYNLGSLDLTSCTIVLNQTGAGGNGGNGSAFSNSSPESGGQGGNGGGILNPDDITAVVARNTLIALNLINVGGAGGTNAALPIFPPLSSAPISSNAETTEQAADATQQIGDTGADGIGFDIGGAFESQKFNLIDMADGSTGFTDGVNGDHVGSNADPIDPLIGPLQMNGGFTSTHALLSQSPAIDQGDSFKIHAD